jgi:hypothetical protein
LPSAGHPEIVGMVISATAYDRHVEQLFETLNRVASALQTSAIEYRVVGGVAIFLHVAEKDPLAARVTRDIDLAVDRRDLDRIAEAVCPLGMEYRHTAGVDMRVNAANPKARSAVHLVMVHERVRPDDCEPVPAFSPPVQSREGILLAPVADLVLMKLASYRLKDRVHIQDLDAAGLITPAIEAALSPELRQRLAEVRGLR